MSKAKPKQPASAPTAAARRSAHGLMVALSVAAAIGIVIILNYVVYWQYRAMSPGARSYVRYDLTATRRYSLSDQSRAVIDGLDKQHRLVTMLGGETIGEEQGQRIRDLADEYGRASARIDVQHIDLDTEAGRRADLLAEMDAMFTEDTAAIRASIADGLSKVSRYARAVDRIESMLGGIVESDVPMRPASIQQQRLADLHSQYLRLQDQYAELIELREQMLGKLWQLRLESPGELTDESPTERGADLPDYSRLMASIQRYVIQLTRQTLADTAGKADQLRRGVVVDGASVVVVQQTAFEAQNSLASLVQQVPDLQKQIVSETDPLLRVLPPLRYEAARAVLSDKPCVLLTADGDARVLPAELLFRGAGAGEGGQTTDLFVGEEQLTGALVSMQLAPPPMVVFVRSNTGRRALSVRGSDEQIVDGLYDYVTKRLLAMDFEVTEWANPLRDEPPTPRAGQRVVWVTMPYLKPNPHRRESLDHTRKNKVAAHLETRLAAGDSALVMLSFNPETDPRLDNSDTADTLVAMLADFGIDAQTYQNASRLSEEAEDPADSVYSSEFIVRQWPGSAIVGKALDGIDSYFLAPMPIIPKAIENGPTLTPLIELTSPAMHVQRSVPDRETGAFTPEPDSSRQSVFIGVAAEQADMRLVAIGDATWALDSLTSLATTPDGKTGPGLAEAPGARLVYPGNTDLFVNCICWLAHEDELIAASPRVQDVRRIDALSPGALKAYRVTLWGGMPAVIFIAGIGVWLMRRRA